MTSQWNNKNCHKFWSRHDFDLHFFKKSYILKVFQLKNKIICFSGVQDRFKIKIKSSSLPEVFCKKGARVTLLQPATLLKKRLWHRVFPVNFAKILRTSFLQTVPHPDAFWYRLKCMGAQKIAAKSSCKTFSISISHKN